MDSVITFLKLTSRESFANTWNRLSTMRRVTGSEFGARMRILNPLSKQESTTVKRRLLTEPFRLQLQETLIQLTGYVEIRMFANGSIKQDIRGAVPHVHVIELDESWADQYFSLTASIVPKTKNKDLTATVRFNNEVLHLSQSDPIQEGESLYILCSSSIYLINVGPLFHFSPHRYVSESHALCLHPRFSIFALKSANVHVVNETKSPLPLSCRDSQ